LLAVGWDTSGKKPNNPVERFSVPLSCKLCSSWQI
jgi:hypothetical protein